MSTTMHAPPAIDQAAMSVEELRQRAVLLQEQLEILRHLNAPRHVLEVVEQAIRDAQKHLSQMQAP